MAGETVFRTNKPPDKYPFPTKSLFLVIITLSDSNTIFKPTLFNKLPETRFLHKEGTYSTSFKASVLPEVSLRKTFPLPKTPAVVEFPMKTHSPSVASLSSWNSALLEQKCLDAPVSSIQSSLFSIKLASTTTAAMISSFSARLTCGVDLVVGFWFVFC